MDGSTSAAAPKKITSKQRLSAATKISAAFKGYKTRKDLASILGQRETQDGTVEEVGGVEYPKQDALDAYKEKIKTATKSHPNDLTDAIKLPIAKEEKETVTTTEAASRMHALREKIKSSTKQAERKANPEGDKAKKEDAAIKIQQYWKNWQKKKREEEINKRRKGAAITIQAAWRGKVVRDAIMAKDSMKGKGGDGKKSPIGGDSPLPSSRGASPLPSSRGGSPLPPPPDRSGADNSDPRRLPAAITIQKNFRGHLARKKYAKAKSADNAEREAAARKIQVWWRGIKSNRVPKQDRDAAPIPAGAPLPNPDDAVNNLASKKFERYPKKLDRRQIERELTPAFNGDVKYVYNAANQQFEVVGVGQMGSYDPYAAIDGIFGHQPKEKAGNDEHLGLGRSPAYPEDNFLLYPSGLFVANYEGPTELQHAISSRRRAIHNANRNNKPLLGPNQMRFAFASYPRYEFNSKGERVAEKDQYILLIEEAKGLTEIFVDDSVIKDIQDTCHKKFEDPATYKKMMLEALKVCKDIANEDERNTKAAKMVREAIRHEAVQELTKDVLKSRQERAEVQKLTDKQVHGIALEAKRGYKFENRLRKLQQTTPPAISGSKHSGIACSESRGGAIIHFNDENSKLDVFWKNLPGTSFFIRVIVAKEDGPIVTFVDGNLKVVEAKKGDVFIDKNTMHYHDGVDYKPLRVYDSVLGQANSLRNNAMARYQGGPRGYKGIQKLYEKFDIQASSNFGGKHKIATKTGLQITNEVTVRPTMSKGVNGERLTYNRKLFSEAEIKTLDLDAHKKSMEPRAEFVECPDYRDEEDKTGKKLATMKSFSDDGKIYAKIYHVGMNSELPNGARVGPGIHREFAVFYKKVGNSYLPFDAKEKEQIDEKWLREYAVKYFNRVELDYQTKDALALKEAKLIQAAISGNQPNLTALLGEHKSVRDAIDAKASEMTAEEKERLLSGFNFNLDAVDARTKKTALHLAAERGDEASVKALLAAGANPNLRDMKGKTPAELARINGYFDANKANKDHFVLLLEDAQSRIKAIESNSEVEELKRDVAVLQARAQTLRDNVIDLEAALLKAAQNAYDKTHARAKQEAITPRDAAATAAIKNAQEEEKGAIKASEQAKIQQLKAKMQLQEAEKELAEKEKKLEGIKEEPKIKAEKRLPTPENYLERYHRIEVDARDDEGKQIPDSSGGFKKKYLEVPYYLAINDKDASGNKTGCVINRRINGGKDGGGNEETIVVNAGEIVLDFNTARFYYDSKTAGFAFAEVRKFYMHEPYPAPTPKGWRDDEWRDAVANFSKFAKEISAADKATQMDMLNADKEFRDVVDAAAVKESAPRVSGGAIPAAPNLEVASTDPEVDPSKSPVPTSGARLSGLRRRLFGSSGNELKPEEGIPMR